MIFRGGTCVAELTNCPNCNQLFVKNSIRDLCDSCYKEELSQFDQVYDYIRKRENRTATMIQVVNATGVSEELIYKFIRTGRLRIAQFPNLGYPCQKCGTLIKDGKLCSNCKDDLTNQLTQLEKEKSLKKELKARRTSTYYISEKD